MFLTNNAPDFPAWLKDAHGTVQAEGRAFASRNDRMVSFASEFVPLYPVGTRMEVVRIIQEKEVHRFTGKVYLSDKQLMRLVSADDELLPGSELVYCGGMSFPAQLAPAPTPSSLLKRLFSVGLPTFPIEITALTHQQFEFQQTITTPLEEGARFQFTAAPPLPAQATVLITQAMLFGPNASYLCDFLDLTPEVLGKLRDYLVIYNLTRNKVF